jgi:uncharacterized protein YeaO (DUF488 family)
MLKEGYIGNWKNYPKDEIKIRVARPSILGPSKELLKDFKSEKIDWAGFEERFRKEILANPVALEKLREIKKLAEKTDVRLICYEKNPPCHRFILMDLIRTLATPAGGRIRLS